MAKCSHNNKNIFCPFCSKYKMVMLLHSKFKNPDIKNPVWYSILSKENKPEKRVLNQMLRRFSTSEFAGKVNVIQFYDNQNPKSSAILELKSI